MNRIAEFIKTSRKSAGLTQEDFAMRSGLGLRFIRELEQGKETIRMDKLNVALAMFGMEAIPGKKGVTSATIIKDYTSFLIRRFKKLPEKTAASTK